MHYHNEMDYCMYAGRHNHNNPQQCLKIINPAGDSQKKPDGRSFCMGKVENISYVGMFSQGRNG